MRDMAHHSDLAPALGRAALERTVLARGVFRGSVEDLEYLLQQVLDAAVTLLQESPGSRPAHEATIRVPVPTPTTKGDYCISMGVFPDNNKTSDHETEAI